ncbi:UTP--glucose-1-phosphate uridylyltransferase [Desulfococcaceae bacterium HSG9]|nr:UTP--glucose-1-phosphate uridylyltransferase [Desulfococcaceae bacterium HSG9]
MNQLDNAAYLTDFVAKMKAEALPDVVIDTFTYYYTKVVCGETGMLSDKEISAVAPDEVRDAPDLNEYAAAGEKASVQAVQIVLNGGLGTSMGLIGPKSLLKVKENRSFLDIIVAQAVQRKTRLCLMNSFSTEQDTRTALQLTDPRPMPMMFLQHKFPKILQKGLAPAWWPDEPALEWNPPGHGDVYPALYASGLLDQLLDNDIRYALICNSDNLGARMDPTLLGYFAENQFPFMMEVASRTPADKKGGHLARHHNGRLILREAAQCPDDEIDAFQNIELYRFFNTNNIWVNLQNVKKLIDQHGAIHLPMILNPKTLDPRDGASPAVLQVETAMGAAISLFEGATAVKVSGDRFFPVKKCNDLLALRSDCFIFSETGALIQNPDRTLPRLKIDLAPQYYGKIDLFDQRFPQGAPSLINCESLTIKGDVRFESDVTIKGNVVLKNTSTSQAVVQKGAMIDADIIW